MDAFNTDLCDDHFPGAKTCRFISLPGGTSYLFAPEKSLCELVDRGVEMTRDAFTDMEYHGIKELDG
jgi:hypothetical protein